MTFLLQAAATTSSRMASRRALALRYKARFSSSWNSRYYFHASPQHASPFVPYDRADNNDKYSNATRQQLRFLATMNKEENNYRHRARARMDKARERYDEGMDKARERYDEVKPKVKAGALSSYEKLKQYGPVFAGTYTAIYIGTLASLYAGVDTGMIDPATIFSYMNPGAEAESKNTADLIIDYLNHYSWTRPAVPFFEKNPHFANLGVAWVGVKFTEPIRLVLTMAIVPRLANYLGYVPKAVEDDEAAEEVVEEAVKTVAGEDVDAEMKENDKGEPVNIELHEEDESSSSSDKKNE